MARARAGQISDPIAQGLTVGQLPGAGEREDKEPAPCLNGLQMGPRGIGCISYAHPFVAPSGQDDRLEPLPKQPLLGLLVGAVFRFAHAKGQRNPMDLPLRPENPHVQPVSEGRLCVQPSFLRRRIFLAPLALEGTIHHPLEYPLFGRGQRRPGLAHQPIHDPSPLPPSCRPQAAQRPGSHRGGGIAGPPRHGGFATTPQVRDHHPTEHPVRAIAEIGLEGDEQRRSCLRPPGQPDQDGAPMQARRMSLNYPSASLLGARPTSTRVPLGSLRSTAKNHPYQTIPYLNL